MVASLSTSLDDSISRFTLGTAQLGSAYGIANVVGPPSDVEAHRLLDGAWTGGITCFDTARSYGDAEARIGKWMAATGNRPCLISKLPPLDDVGSAAVAIQRHFDASCRALGAAHLDGYLVHRADDLRHPAVRGALRRLRAEGRLRAFGASAYSVAQAGAALDVPDLTLLQVPINLFDRRFVDSAVLAQCRDRSIHVFARSVFLQGCFLMRPQDLPPRLQGMREHLSALAAVASRAGEPVLQLALAAVRDLPGVSSVVVGAETAAQVREIIAAANRPPLPQALADELWQIGRGLPDNLVNPSFWPRP